MPPSRSQTDQGSNAKLDKFNKAIDVVGTYHSAVENSLVSAGKGEAAEAFGKVIGKPVEVGIEVAKTAAAFTKVVAPGVGQAGRSVGTLTGAWVGAKVGAEVGAAVGLMFAPNPPVGAAVVGGIGGFVGGLGGAYAGEEAVKQAQESLTDLANAAQNARVVGYDPSKYGFGFDPSAYVGNYLAGRGYGIAAGAAVTQGNILAGAFSVDVTPQTPQVSKTSNISSPDLFHSQNPADRQLTQPGMNSAPHGPTAGGAGNNQQYDRDHQGGAGPTPRSGNASIGGMSPSDRDSAYGGSSTTARSGNAGIGGMAPSQRDSAYGGSSPGSSRPSGGSAAATSARTGNDPTGRGGSNESGTGNKSSGSSPSSSGNKSSSGKSSSGSSKSNDGSSRSTGSKNDPSHTSGSKAGGPRPVLLDLDGNGVRITELSRSTMFMDSGGDGLLHRTAWAGAGDGVLFFDANGDGKIGETREYVFTEWDPTATSDLEALRAAFDGNGDGKLTAADASFTAFKVLVTNADGSTTAKTLAELGIMEIALKGDATEIAMPDGSVITGQATFRTATGTAGIVADAVLESEEDGSRVVQSVSIDVSGNRVVVIRSYGGGEIASAITSVTSRDGKTILAAFDDDGDGVTDHMQAVATTVSADVAHRDSGRLRGRQQRQCGDGTRRAMRSRAAVEWLAMRSCKTRSLNGGAPGRDVSQVHR